MPDNTITAFNPGGPSAGQPLDVVPSGSGSRPSLSTPQGAPPGRVSSSSTAPRGAVLPGPQRIELDSTPVISVSVPMQFDTLAAVPMTLTVPRGLLDHPESNTSGLSGDALRRRVEQLLGSLPPGCAKWSGDEGGEIVARIGTQNLHAQFGPQRQLKYLSLGSEGQPSTLRLSEQGWLRGAIGAKGVSVPADAPAWKLPGSGQPVFCDGDIPRRENDFPDALGQEADLRELALEALAQGLAGNHVQRGDGSASFDMPFRGHTLNVTYEHENQEVQSLRVSRGTESLGRWSHTDELDDELLRETESRPTKRLKTVPDDMTNWDADLTRVNDHPTSVTTIDIDFDDDGQVNELLDDIMGSSTGTGESARPMDIDTPVDESSTPIRKNKGKAAVRPGDDDPVDIEPASTGQTALLPAPQYTMPPVLLSYRARQQVGADAELKALADAFKHLFASASSTRPSSSGRSQGTGRSGATTSMVKLPAHLRKFLEQVLEGDGATLPGVNPRVQLYEKTVAAQYANLPSNVRDMPCVSAATGGTTVKLLALRGAEPGQFAKVMVYSPENQATLEGMAQSGEHVDSQPLPQPGAIRDALEGLFEGDANAPQLRVLALLQTPAYALGTSAIKALRVEDTAHGERIGGVQISGQDEPDNPNTDWSRIVKPWLDQRSTSEERLLTIAEANLQASIKALAAQLPALGMLCVHGTPQVILQRAAAATLEAAGVPVKLMHDGTKAEPLKLGHVADDGSCPPARLSEAGKSILRAHVQLRTRDLPSGEGPGEQPLFVFHSYSAVESAITTHWRSQAADEASRADLAPPEPRFPAAGEINTWIGSELKDSSHPEVSRACVRLVLPPYCLSTPEIQALNIHDGEIVAPAAGGWQALDIAGRQDTTGTGSDNDWARIFKPMLDVLSNNGTEPIPNGLFLRGRDSRGKLIKVDSSTPATALGTVARARPELGFLAGKITTASAMQACAAAVLREAGAPDNLLKYGGLRLGDVGNDGSIAQVPNLSDAGKSTVLAWKRLQERTLASTDPLFPYRARSDLNRAISSHHERMASAAAAAASSSNT